MSTTPLLKEISIRREVLEGIYQKAIDIVEIDRGTAPEFLRDPVEFFKRTAVTPGIKELVVKTLMALLNVREAKVGDKRYTIESKLFVLPSLFGGGKSHALATLYHVVKTISTSRSRDEAHGKLAALDADIAGFVREHWESLARVKPTVVIVHGMYSDYAPTPFDGKPVKTLWGYIADKLGGYQAMSRYDEELVVPPNDVIEQVITNKGAVILVDEIAHYYTRIHAQGSRNLVDKVNAFLQGLSTLLGSKEVPSVAVVLTLPYSYEKEIVEKAHAGLLDMTTVKRILDRVRTSVIVPTKPEDISVIVRKRLFDEDPSTLEKYGKQIARVLREKVPSEDVRKLYASKEVEDKFARSYPVHPETIDTLKSLFSFMSEYLQLARSPLEIIAEALRSVKQGCFDWMGFEPHLLMPYHIPVFDDSVLLANFPATEPELLRFRHILEDSIVRVGREGETCSPKLSLRDYVSEGYLAPVYAIAVYVWLRSLPGRGFASNLDIYPTPEKIALAVLDPAVAVDDKWYDVKATLEHEVSRLPHINEENERWFFKWTPRIHELVARYVKDTTDEEARRYLVNLLVNYFTGKPDEKAPPEQRTVFTGDTSSMLSIDGEGAPVDGRLPVVMVFTRGVSDDELAGYLSLNNIVALVPDIAEKMPLEEARRYKIQPVGTYWDALLLVVKHLIVVSEKLTDEDLENIYREEVERDPELLKTLKKNLSKLEEEYEKYSRILFTKVYNTVKLKRGNQIVTIPLKYLQDAKPSFSAVERSLREHDFVIPSVDEQWVVNLARKLNIPVDSEDGISLNALWQYLLTGSDSNIPVASLDWFVRNALKPVRKLEYAVVVKNRIYWKHVFSSKSEAVSHLRSTERKTDELPQSAYEELVKTVKQSLAHGEEVRLVHYTKTWEKWIEQAVSGLHGEVLVLTDDKQDRLVDKTVLQADPLAHVSLKSGAVFREKYRIAVSVEHPREVDHGAPFDIVLKATSTTVKSAVVKIAVQGARPESIEKPVSTPYEEKITLEPLERALEIRISATAEDESSREVLGRCEAVVAVKKPVGEVLREEVLTVENTKRYLESGVPVEDIREVEIASTEDFFRAIPVLREIAESCSVKAVLSKVELITSRDLTVDELMEIVNAIVKLKEKFAVSDLLIRIAVHQDKRTRIDIVSRLPGTVKLRAVIKEKQGG